MLDAVLFDFDYTLADSSPGILECARHACTELGLSAFPDDVMRAQIGLPLEGTLERVLGPDHGVHDEAWVRFYRQRADAVMTKRTTLYAPVPGVFAGLRERGIGVGIVTTKYRYRVDEILEREALRVDAVVGAEDVTALKPDPEPLHVGLERLGARAERTLYVGDTVVDAEAAARAGVSFAAVLTGVTDPDAFLPYPTVALWRDVGGIADVLGEA